MASAQVRFIADLHFGHERLIRGLRGMDPQKHDGLIESNWNKTVRSPKDITYILGDIGMERSTFYHLLGRLNGRKIVVLGNHDRHQDVREMLKYVESVAGMINYKGFVLTHCPIHESCVENIRGNIHGHVHSKSIDHPKYYNVSAEVIDYTPITLEELLNKTK